MHKKYNFLVGSINEIDVKMVNNQLPSNYAYYKVDGAGVTNSPGTLVWGGSNADGVSEKHYSRKKSITLSRDCKVEWEGIKYGFKHLILPK